MQSFTPKHLSRRPSRSVLGRDPVVVAELLILLVGMVLVMTLVLASGFGRDEPEGSEAVMAPSPDRSAGATTPPSQAVSSTRSPPSTGGGQRQPDRGNLLANPGFEAGLTGWVTFGGATMDQIEPGKEGRSAASFTAGPSPAPGIAYPRVAPGRDRVTFVAMVWLRASRPGTTVKLGLLETVRGARFAVDTIEVVVGPGWQRFEVAHPGHVPTSWLAFEVTAPNLPRGVSVQVDGVEVRTKAPSFMSMTTR